MKINIRMLYLYLFAIVGLFIIVFAAINMIDIGLKTFVFKDADKYVVYPMRIEDNPKLTMEEIEKQVTKDKLLQDQESTRQKQRELSNAISMLIVGVPLYLYHWKLIQKEKL